MNRSIITLLLALFVSSASAFVVQPASRAVPSALQAQRPHKLVQIATTAAIVISTSPLVALAEEVDGDYEYGAVSAPIGLAWGVGVLAILTALLPIALQGGEEEFEKMKNQDADTWGSGNADALNKNRRR